MLIQSYLSMISQSIQSMISQSYLSILSQNYLSMLIVEATVPQINIYLENHAVSVPSSELGPPSHTRVYPPPGIKGGTHSPAGEGVIGEKV